MAKNENVQDDASMAELANLLNGMNQDPEGETKTITGEGEAPKDEEVTGGEETEKKAKGERKAKEPPKSMSDLFKERNIGKNEQYTQDSVAGKLMTVNSKLSSIAGFIIPNSPRIDIAVTRSKISKKDETPEKYKTVINVKEKFSQQVKGVIINYVPELVTRISEERSARGEQAMTGEIDVIVDGKRQKVARKNAEDFLREKETLNYVTKVMGYEEAIKWMIDFCWFEIAEAPSIFWSHKKTVSKTVNGQKTFSEKEIKSAADLTASQGTSYIISEKYNEVKKRYEERVEKVNSENASLSADAKKKKAPKAPTLKDIFPLSSKYRGRKLAIPGNYIAIKKYIHVPTKTSYTAEEQAENNMKYIREAFNPRNVKSFKSKFQDMNAEAKEKVTITENGDVTASQFFNDTNSLVASSDYLKTVQRWWGKEDKFTPLEMKLVKKEIKHVDEKQKSDGTVVAAYDKPVLVYDEFGKDGNRLSNAEYKNIVEATEGRLNEEEVLSFISSLSTKSKRDPNVRGKINYDSTVSSDVIMSQLNALIANSAATL